MRTLRAVPAILAFLIGCGDSPATLEPRPDPPGSPVAESDSARIRARLVVLGNPEGASGATWSYRDTVAGVVYDMTGVLFKPAGAVRAPGIIVSHGFGGSANGYSRTVATSMARWGAVVIATNYTHAAGANENAVDVGASVENVRRARRLASILRALGYVDTTRLAAHGHSMGAFVTIALAASHPGLLRAASHTAGGVRPDVGTGAAPTESQARAVRAPYQMHHGDRDVVVTLAADRRFDELLAEAGTVRELHVYPGVDHPGIAFDAVMLERVRAWYVRHGVLPPDTR